MKEAVAGYHQFQTVPPNSVHDFVIIISQYPFSLYYIMAECRPKSKRVKLIQPELITLKISNGMTGVDITTSYIPVSFFKPPFAIDPYPLFMPKTPFIISVKNSTKYPYLFWINLQGYQIMLDESPSKKG